MAIVQADLHWNYTGASANDEADIVASNSLGTHMSSCEIAAGDNGLFDDVTGAEAAAGATEYRGVGFINEHATLTLSDVRVWIQADTGNAEDDISFAVEASDNACSGSLQTIANETTSPSGAPSWSDGTSKATGLSCPLSGSNMQADEWFGVWIRRAISAAASAAAAESVTIRAEGDTPA